MSNGKGLTFLALILGLVGIGLGGYSVITTVLTPPTETPGVQNYWYINNFGSLPVTNTGQFVYVSPLSLIITVNEGEDVYVSYSGYAEFNPGGSELRILVYYNEQQTAFEVRFEIPNPASDVRYPFAVQGIIASASPGTHNISIRADASDALTEVWRSSLYVTTLK